jgi:hypothetical protein
MVEQILGKHALSWLSLEATSYDRFEIDGSVSRFYDRVRYGDNFATSATLFETR